MRELKRVLDARGIAILTVGSVIGSGIFLVPSGVLRDSGGSVGLATLVWVLGGILSFLGALTYAEMGAMNPQAGGLYLYLRDGFGRAVAFGYGWTLFLVIGAGTVATLAVASTNYLAALVPMSPAVQKVVAITLAFGTGMLNVFGTDRSTTIVKWGTGLKLAAIALLVLVLPILGSGFRQVDRVWPAAITGSTMSSLGLALVSVLWAYEGWQYLTFMAGETIDPQRNFPKGLALGVVALIVIYVAAATAYIAGIGPTAVAASSRVAADAASTVIGPIWGKLIAIPIIVSMMTAAQANSLASARVYFAMARDGVFFPPMARIHPKYGTPAFAIVAAAVWAAVLAASGTFEVLLKYVIFVGWLFYGLGGLALIALRRKQPDASRPFKVPGYPVTPVLFALSGFAIVINTVYLDPPRGLIGLGAAALAIPVYYVWRAFSPGKGSAGG